MEGQRGDRFGGRRGIGVALASAIVLVIGSSVALGAIPGIGGVISSCYAKTGGYVRVIDADTSNCKGNETLLTWNQQGPKGDKGDQGEQGIQGIQGEQGIQGIQGDPGADGVSGWEFKQVIAPLGAGDIAIFDVNCTTPKHVLGGWFALTVPWLQVLVSAPNGSGTGWRLVISNTGADSASPTGYAVCADVSP